MKEAIRSLLYDTDMDDPHAFATAYAAHCDSARSSGREPVAVGTAALGWLMNQQI